MNCDRNKSRFRRYNKRDRSNHMRQWEKMPCRRFEITPNPQIIQSRCSWFPENKTNRFWEITFSFLCANLPTSTSHPQQKHNLCRVVQHINVLKLPLKGYSVDVCARSAVSENTKLNLSRQMCDPAHVDTCSATDDTHSLPTLIDDACTNASNTNIGQVRFYILTLAYVL